MCGEWRMVKGEWNGTGTVHSPFTMPHALRSFLVASQQLHQQPHPHAGGTARRVGERGLAPLVPGGARNVQVRPRVIADEVAQEERSGDRARSRPPTFFTSAMLLSMSLS